MFSMKFLNSTKETNRLRKEISTLSSKGMSNVYLKVIIKKNWRSQNFDFLSLKICHQVSFLGAPTHADIIEL